MLNSHGLEFDLSRIAIIIFFASLAGVVKLELIKQKAIFSKQIRVGIVLFLIALILIILREKYILWQILIFFKVIFIYNESNIIYKTIKNSVNYSTNDISNSAAETTNKISRLKDNALKSISTGFFSSLSNDKPNTSKDATNKINSLKNKWIQKFKLGFLFNNGLAIVYYLITANDAKPAIILILAINFIIQLIIVALFNYQLKVLKWKREKYVIPKALMKKFISLILLLIILISTVAFLLPSGPEVSSLRVVVDQLNRFDVEPGARGLTGDDPEPPEERPSLEGEHIEDKEEDMSIIDGIFGTGVIIYFLFFAVTISVILIMLLKPEVVKTFKLFALLKNLKLSIDISTIKTKLFSLFKVIIANLKGLLQKSNLELDNDSDKDEKKSKLKTKSKEVEKRSEKKQQIMNDLLRFLNLLAENDLTRTDSQTINEFFDKLKGDLKNQQGVNMLKEIAGKSFYSHLDMSEKEELEIEKIIESLKSELNLV